MSRLNLLIILVLCATGVYPASSISRWFSSSYYDLRVAMRRYGHCVGELAPLKYQNLSESDFLIYQMRTFLDHANYDNEQLANISALMDNLCRPEGEDQYPISVHLDVDRYSNNGTGKENRCRAIDETFDAMFPVFRRAAWNRSEPLDFSAIQFYPNASDKSAFYNLTDLINTVWIKSDTQLESICRLTDSLKDYVKTRSGNSTAQDRALQHGGALSTIIELIDRFLEPLLGLQRRLYWEGNNRLELGYSRISNQLGSLRSGFGNRYKSTRDRIASIFVGSTITTASNATFSPNLNVTAPLNVTKVANQLAPVEKSTTFEKPLATEKPFAAEKSVTTVPATTVAATAANSK